MKQIRIYHTHIEIEPYKQKEDMDLEFSLSIRKQITPKFSKLEPIAYHIENSILYVPRGINLLYLEKRFQTKAVIINKHDPIDFIENIRTEIVPKSRTQEESIDFLSCTNQFVKGISYSQQSLNIGTGEGKTIAALAAIANKHRVKTIVIINRVTIINTWIAEINKALILDENRVMRIDGSDNIEKLIKNGESPADFYFITHQSITSYATKHGWNSIGELFKVLRVGIKIFDEAHQSFKNIMRIDFFTNTRRTWYITATFKRTDYIEARLFNKVFSNTYRFGIETKDYEERRKHIKYYAVSYNSYPEDWIDNFIHVNTYANSNRYTEYALNIDKNQAMLKALRLIMNKHKTTQGRILILSSKIESTELIANAVKSWYNRDVAVINSERKIHWDNDSEIQIISSTSKSLGESVNIRNLRILINLEAFSSSIILEQMKGRLREYSTYDYTYMYDIFDIGLKDISRLADSRYKMMKKFAYEMHRIEL